MGVELDLFVSGAVGAVEDLAGGFDGVKDGLGSAGAAGIFEGDAVERDSGSDDLVEAVDVEFGGVGIALVDVGSKTHHGHGDLVLQTVLGDGASGNLEVADVVESVEVTDGGDTVFLEEFGVEFDDVG